jgi:hypothetical protein
MSSAAKDKNVILILSIISVVFAMCNVPQAVCRIMNESSRAKDADFQVMPQITFFTNATWS